jgi:hypothetical protein
VADRARSRRIGISRIWIPAAAIVGTTVVAALLSGAVALSWASAKRVAMGAPQFVDETSTSGVVHTFATLEGIGVGGGVAAFDCNNDGKPDLYIAGGSNAATLLRNDSPIGGALHFTPVGDAATDLTGVTGAYPLDLDGDGNVDLAVLRVGGVELLRGLGGCRFERANKRWSFDGGGGWATAFSATWEGPSAFPTIAIGNYLRLDAMGPASYACDHNSLLRPDAAGTGYATPLILSPGYCALSMLFSDWDRSGRRDLRISNDRHYYDFVNGEEQLWRIAPGAPPRAYTAADGWVQMQIWGMGIASYDVTGDGYPEVFLTNQGPNRLQTLEAGPSQPTYRDIGLKRGANAIYPYAGDVSLPSTAWHDQFEDVNNDGFMDLFISKGNVGRQADYAIRDPSDLLLGQPDGTFAEAAGAAGLTEFSPGRGAALVDLNLDGRLDLVEVKLGDRVRVWRNLGTGNSAGGASMGHWLELRLVEPGANRDAIGAWVEIRVGEAVQRRELTIGGGHASGSLGWMHFGLGLSSAAEIRVTWPDGQVGPWSNVAADGFFLVDRSAGTVRRWSPGQ